MLFRNAFFPTQHCQDDYEWVRKWVLLVKLRLKEWVRQRSQQRTRWEIWGDRTKICGDFNWYLSLELISKGVKCGQQMCVRIYKASVNLCDTEMHGIWINQHRIDLLFHIQRCKHKILQLCEAGTWAYSAFIQTAVCALKLMHVWTQAHTLAGDEINFFTPVVATSARHICQDGQASHLLHNKSTAQPFTD